MLFRWAVNRFVPVWLQVVFVAGLMAAVAWQEYSRRDASYLTGHNHMDRPISSYWVNGHWGLVGTRTCCGIFKSETAEVSWELSITADQERQGMEVERYNMSLPMPERQQGDQYLHAHFLPGNRVELAWSPNSWSPKLSHQQSEYRMSDPPLIHSNH